MQGMKSRPGIARRLLLAATLLGFAIPALPQAGSYTLEIIVFRNGGEAGALAPGDPGPAYVEDDVAIDSATSRKLGGQVARLNRAGLTVLAQAAWKQEPTVWQREQVASNTRRGVSAARLGLAGMSGKVIFERGDYLHLGLDLVVEAGGRRYRISEVRSRIRADEIHYFDHPAIGVLAVLSRD
jgi:hypothetical protein